MRVGYSLGPLLSASEVLTCARLADAKDDVDSVWVPESWGRESFATLGAISQITKRVRLGTSIVSIFSRTPATVAMGAATLDMLSGNRAVIGVGSSTEAIVENWHGAKFEKPVSRMREFVECLNLMTSGERVNYDGKFFRASNFKMLNSPTRKHVPVFMAAVNKKMVSLACELADGVILYLRPLDELKKTVAEIRRASAGRQFEIALSLICAVSDDDPEDARRRAAKTLAFYVAVGKYYSKFLAENGFAAEVEKIKQEYGKGGNGTNAVTDRMLDSLSVCGTRQDCRKALSRFVEAGVTLPIMQVNPVKDAEGSFREMLSTF
ncbi:MAG: LLM class flavin-dependent oxidoreductase [Nitrososphaera sp.]|uniref:LLM class flavin-dependent oxidoreductase n=2 Tax=Nitrososphaera sp. TaxID=1971748 RepID=UPI0017BBEFF2|nr:LLM class flavin-dependent oxidoreductase [Nitrososphaera sp.]NWG37627.1 LLM class flavin-dependent oxidoreductase [Nitrososphaera sp.]